jgi:tRNA (cmo5U34)-methyltransferase
MTDAKLVDFDTNLPIPTSEYDRMAQLSIPGYEALHQMVLAFLRFKLPKIANLLIVGAGSGMELVTFGKENLQWQLLGLDPSANMLAIARKKIEQQGLSERVKLFQGYTHELPETILYDAATCILVMHFLPDDGSKLALLESIAQKIKPAANFILVDMFGEKNTALFEQLVSIWRLYSQGIGLNSEILEQREQALRESIHPIPEPRVLELLQQAGFGNTMQFYTGLIFGGWIATKN